jgi:uncharacterized protein YutE (UPF0331/DUF86 family)
LQTKSQITQEDYEKDFDRQLITERLLNLIIESAMNINSHLVVSSDQPPPESYFDSFIAAGKVGIISVELAQQLAPSAGLRNRLVHAYGDVDTAIVYRSITVALQLFPQYIKQIENYLQQR